MIHMVEGSGLEDIRVSTPFCAVASQEMQRTIDVSDISRCVAVYKQCVDRVRSIDSGKRISEKVIVAHTNSVRSKDREIQPDGF